MEGTAGLWQGSLYECRRAQAKIQYRCLCYADNEVNQRHIDDQHGIAQH